MDESIGINIRVAMSGTEGQEDETEEREESGSVTWKCTNPDCGFTEQRELE